ncbi:MAG: hypothetical protein QF535_01295 [Anaerolineales bacterium]|jgi:hypothetical protein|nr:hypothetical protein [Anaerolineales bacterium]
MSDIAESPSDIRVWKVFKYLQEAFGKIGMRVDFPKHTDPKKTYKWRYIVNFIEKLDELGASNDTVIRIIEAIAKYANKHKQSHKGLSLLTSDFIIQICCENVEKAGNSNNSILLRIEKDAAFIRQNDLSAQKGLGLPNIVKWYMQRTISDSYIALSRRCYEVMLTLDSIERSMLPNGKELIRTRMELFKDARLKHKIKLIMGDDWRSIFG